MNEKLEKLLKVFSIIIFTFYLLLLVWVIMFKCGRSNVFIDTYEFFKNYSLTERFNFYLIPFLDYFEGPFLIQIDNIISDDILNICIFTVMGLYITYFTKKNRLLKTILISFLVSTFFELFQLFTMIGSFATKDIITNTFGGLLGYLACLLLYKKNNSTIKLCFLTVISGLVILALIPIMVYAFKTTIGCLDAFLDILFKRM